MNPAKSSSHASACRSDETHHVSCSYYLLPNALIFLLMLMLMFVSNAAAAGPKEDRGGVRCLSQEREFETNFKSSPILHFPSTM